MIDNFGDFYDKLIEMPDSEEKMELILEAIDWSIEEEEDYYLFCLRFQLASTATFLGQYEVLFENYFWCSEFFAENQEQLEDWAFEMLWATKWALEHLPKFPLMDKELIEELFEEFKENCLGYGYELRPYYQYKHRHHRILGETDKAKQFYDKWIITERDDLADCFACEKQQQMEFLLERGQLDKGLALAEEVLSGVESCQDAPLLTYSKLLLPFYEMKRIDEAKEFQTRGYFLIHQKSYHLVEASEHMIFLSLVEPKQALHIFKRHIDYARENLNPHGQFYFYLATWFMIERFKKEELPISLPADNFERVVREIANDYDTNNKNTYYNDTIKKVFSFL